MANRVEEADRRIDKDALDILRLLRAVPTQDLADGIERLARAALSRAITAEALQLGSQLLDSTNQPAVQMAVRAAGPSEEPAVIAASVVALWRDLARSKT